MSAQRACSLTELPEVGAMRVVLRRPFLDATSGMYAANAKALPILALPGSRLEALSQGRYRSKTFELNGVPVGCVGPEGTRIFSGGGGGAPAVRSAGPRNRIPAAERPCLPA